MSKFVSKSQTCLPPIRSYHVLMVQLDTTERIVSRSSQCGMNLHGSYIHAGTGEVLRDITYNLEGAINLYFFASDKEALSSWHYVLQWIPRLGRYACSCRENKLHGHCGHAQELIETATATPEKIPAVA